MAVEIQTATTEEGVAVHVGDVVETHAEEPHEVEVIPARARVLRIVDNGPYKDYKGPNLVWCRFAVYLEGAKVDQFSDGGCSIDWVKKVVGS